MKMIRRGRISFRQICGCLNESSSDPSALLSSDKYVINDPKNNHSSIKIATQRNFFHFGSQQRNFSVYSGGSHQQVKDLLSDAARSWLTLGDQWLEVATPSWKNPLKFSLMWLRDHCQCPSCKDPKTGMRVTGELAFPLVELRSSEVLQNALHLTWADGHLSSFDLDWLWQYCYEGQQLECKSMDKVLWNSRKASTIPFAEVSYDEFMMSHNAVKIFLSSLLSYGIAILKNVPISEAHSRLAMERLGPIWRTFWGETYHVVKDLTEHSHPSYTGEELKYHTDTNYYYEGAGLQLFHCLEHTGTGANNRFVDGFHAAEMVKRKHPDVYHYLSTHPVTFKYIEGGENHLMNEDIFLKHHPVTKELVQIRFTPYDFDVFRTVKFEDVERHYKSIKTLWNEINDSENAHYIQLNPGTVVVTDNWRVLHGRTAFTGKRTLYGMYVSRSDFLSSARKYGLLE